MREALSPVTAQAGTGYAMQEGAGGIENGKHIYFGTKDETTYTWTDAAPYWRVLDKTNTNAGSSGMFLLSENLIGNNPGGTYGNVYFDDTTPHSNAWNGSTAQTWCSTFLTNVFPREQYAILATNKSDDSYTSSTLGTEFNASTDILSGDKVFFLSAEEAENRF